jgi:hypothetical protein
MSDTGHIYFADYRNRHFVLAPIFHRVLHHFHMETKEQDWGRNSIIGGPDLFGRDVSSGSDAEIINDELTPACGCDAAGFSIRTGERRR